MEKEKYVIAHDVGTGGSKACVTDSRGRILASSFKPYPTDYPKENWAEQNPDDWWRAITQSTREVLEEVGIDAEEVGGVIFASQMIGILPVDSSGSPLRQAIIWLDGRAEEQAQRIVRRFTKTILLTIAGGVPTGKDVIPKLMWLKENEPDVYDATYKFLDVTSYLVYRCSGEYAYDYSAASGTGMFSFRKKDWDDLMFKLFKLDREKMPKVCPSFDRVGSLKQDAASEMGLRSGIPVFCGTGDAPSAALGSGAVLDGEGHLYVGSSGWVAATMPKALNDGRRGIVSIASAEPSKYLLFAEMESAGACFKWLADELGPIMSEGIPKDDIYSYLDEIALKSPPGSNGLIFCPWMYGERSPIPDTTVRGGFINLSLDNKLEDIVRSVLEGVALHTRWIVDTLGRCGFRPNSLRIIGGGAKSDLWVQILADVLGRDIERVAEPQESGARGAALIAFVGLGVYKDISSLRKVVEVTRVFHPHKEHREIYDGAYVTIKEVYGRLRKLYSRINKG